MSEQRGGARWRYRFGGEVHGPYGFHDLRVLAAQGKLPRHAQVAEEGSEDWRDVSVMPAFADALDNPALAAHGAPAEPPPTARRPTGRVRSRLPETGRPEATAGAAEPPPAAPRPPVSTGAEEEAAPAAGTSPDLILAHAVYGLYVLNFFFAPFAGVIGVIIAYFKRNAVALPWLGSHFRWQIRTFWYSVAVTLLTVLILPLIGFLGWLIMLLGAIWIIYRIAIGWWQLAQRQPIGDVDPVENTLWEQGRKLTGSSRS